MSAPRRICLVFVLSLMAAACFRTNRVPGFDEDGKPIRELDEPRGGRGGGDDEDELGPSDDTDDPGDPSTGGTPAIPGAETIGCIRGGYCGNLEEVASATDALFVVDNSGSMRQEQAALREQFPRLIAALTSGVTSSGERFPAVDDLHLGVVSTDMGLAGIANNFPGCNTQKHINGGDDGVLQHPGSALAGCHVSYPPFLSYTASDDNANQLATDFACIAALGSIGCGFEQQLEAGLKALWPKNYRDREGNIYPPEMNPILFLSTTDEGRYGHGDTPNERGGNGGFLRRDSVLAIVIVTDEEDCSSKNTSHFISTNDPADPLSRQGINLRCFYNQQNLFEPERYIKGFQGLRAGYPERLAFAAIVGVPVELVSAEVRSNVDFSDESQRAEYYDRILDDERMLNRPMNENVPAIANVAPSCTRTDEFGERADAYPPRRIVEVAKGLGENAIVQSICQDDFTPAMDGIIQLLRKRRQVECLPQPLPRTDAGLVACEVLWEFPANGPAIECDDMPFLSEVERPRSQRGANGGRLCRVDQVKADANGAARGEGFYYDDVSPVRGEICRDGAAPRIGFTAGARIPEGVRAFVDCKK